MEKVHKTETRPWISSPINVKEFRDKWSATLYSQLTSTKEVFQFNSREFSEIEEECGLAAMKCPRQHNVEISKQMVIPEHVQLLTLKYQQEDLERRQGSAPYEAVVYANNRYYNYPPHQNFGDDTKERNNTPFEQVADPEVLLCVQIFRPEKRNDRYFKNTGQRTPVFQIDQEFMVLGCQLLTELRDKIDCVSDRAIPGEYSECPDLPAEVTCKDLYKSGFFYIDGVFYNDMRHQDCRDYSEHIIKWSKVRSHEIGPFRKALMEKSKFIDLNIQLGYPYVYVHQGYCEHLIVFSDLLKHTHFHNPNRNEYPHRVVVKPKKRALCMICRHHITEWIVYDHKYLPEIPYFFCKKCFFDFNYDENDEKIEEFKAYHHIDRSAIL